MFGLGWSLYPREAGGPERSPTVRLTIQFVSVAEATCHFSFFSFSLCFSSLLEPALANEGTAARLSTAGATNTAFWSTSRRVVSSALCSAAITGFPYCQETCHTHVCVYGPGTLPDYVAGCERPLRVPSPRLPSAAFLDAAGFYAGRGVGSTG